MQIASEYGILYKTDCKIITGCLSWRKHMDVKAIIFDKDGTLLDFNAFWITVSVYAINDILKKAGKEDIDLQEILSVWGVHDGKADVNGLLCKGTYEQMGLALHEVLKAHGAKLSPEETVRLTAQAYTEHAEAGEIKPTCENLREVLVRLKERGIKLAVVTTDNKEITHKCLEKLEIFDLFDRVFTDDGKTPVKPDPWCVTELSQSFGISPQNMVMVGDTMTDILFARNAGIFVICVGDSAETGKQADAFIPDVSHIFEVIGEKSL